MHKLEAAHYTILNLVWQFVKEDAYPLKCKLRPRDLILRSMQGWTVIQASLEKLQEQGLVIITRQGEFFEISITEEGLAMCKDKF